MYSRLAQVSRRLSFAAAAAARTTFVPLSQKSNLLVGAAGSAGARRRNAMASADERNSCTIHTAACLIIGDEVLGGKTVDTNSGAVAKWCFQLGIDLKRIEVIADDESEIIEAVRRMSDRYDFVVTSGGIGPTHDDITYSSIAKAFNLKLVLHERAYDRMRLLSKPHPSQPNFDWDEDSSARRAKLRMVELPTDPSRDPKDQFIFPREELWVPVCVVNGNVHILPGVPRLFVALLDGLKPYIRPRLEDPEAKGICRVMISTPLSESAVAGYLTQLAGRVEPMGIKIGSYPRWNKKTNTVTLVGKNKAAIDSIVPEVLLKVQGKVISIEGEDDDPNEKEESYSQ